MADEVLTGMGRTGKYLCMEHWNVLPDIVSIGKGFGNGFPVTAVAVREPFKESFEKISASSSYGGNPMACAAALASLEVMQEENLLERAIHLEKGGDEADGTDEARASDRRRRAREGLPVRHRAGQGSQYQGAVRQGRRAGLQKAFAKGSRGSRPAISLRMSPPIIMEDEVMIKGLDIIDEAIGEAEKELR